MPNSSNEELVRSAMGAFWSEGKSDLISELYSPNYTRHDPWAPGISGHEGLLDIYKTYRKAIPDLSFPIDFTLSDGDKVAVQYWMQGTHKETLLAIPATNREFLITCTGIFRIEDGLIVEDWHNYDMLGLLQALGVIGYLEALDDKRLD